MIPAYADGLWQVFRYFLGHFGHDIGIFVVAPLDGGFGGFDAVGTDVALGGGGGDEPGYFRGGLCFVADFDGIF